MPVIDKFQENPNIFIFLISTLAGGTGLNLTKANKVVIFGALYAFFAVAPSWSSCGFSYFRADPNWSQCLHNYTFCC
jgi:hypothetical protein